jgi:uncharacterized coiled-coil protein SlyX
VNGTLREVLTELEVKVAVLTVEIKNLNLNTSEHRKLIDLCKQESRIATLEEKVEPLRDSSLRRQGAMAVWVMVAGLAGGAATVFVQWLLTIL